MKIAYLVLAHNTPTHLGRLVAALSSSDASLLVHVDKKASLAEYEPAALAGDVTFIEPRIPVYWADFSQVQAILLLIRAGLADPRHFDRFVLLSGSDYPLRSAAEVERFFAANSDSEFINLVPMPWPGKPLWRLTNYKLRPTTPRPFRAVQRGLMILHLLPRTRDYKRYFGEMAPYGGSTWWALSRLACEYISGFAEREKRFVKFHEHTRCPDESFFQTILGNSPFRSKIVRNLTWADWAHGTGRGNPATLSALQMPFLESGPDFPETDDYGPGPMLFARKFPDDSIQMVETLNKRIAERAGQSS